ncbi:Flap-structured DNA-binding and RNA-binding protein [Rhodotorula kratochvilovae]
MSTRDQRAPSPHDALAAPAAAPSSTRANTAAAAFPSPLSASGPGRFPASADPSTASHPASQNKFRASLGGPGVAPPAAAGSNGPQSANWRQVSPGRASTGAVGLGSSTNSLRPASELLSVSHGAVQQPQGGDTIDRWFEDLQQYEATLEEMAAASLDANFKEELSAIEQWFRVLSEAERTAALYSLLQSATPLQMRFFITVLQQMARQDPVSAALLSPANPSQLSFENQMEAKLASFGLKSPASPVVRQFARQSLAASGAAPAGAELLSPDLAGTAHAASPAASTLASQRAKLKASARTSAPANLLLGASGGAASLGEGLKSPLWGKDETVRERSPSPRPKSTGSDGAQQPQPQQPLASSASGAGAYLRSPVLDGSFENQLSPLVGGSWASMVNTPLVPMFGKGETMEQGNYGASPNLDSVGQRLGGWNGGAAAGAPTSPNLHGGIVLDDARKFRRSARVSGSGPSGGLNGGALGGMYDDASHHAPQAQAHSSHASDRAQSAATAQKRVQDQLHAVQQLKNMQQSAINLGLGALGGSPNPASPAAPVGGSRLTSTGALSSPGLQQTAMAAQQNWRNANAAHLPPPSPSQGGGGDPYGLNGLGMGGVGSPGLAGLGVGGPGSPSAQQIQAQTQAQLASLVALQQQMIQQQQQLQSLASLNGLGIPNAGLGVGIGMGGAGGFLGPQQISPRLGGGGSPNAGFGLGFGGGMPSPRRSPRPHGSDRSPNFSSYGHSSRPGGGSSSAAGAGANPQQTPGSGANPDEPLDMALLGDTPAWLRSLRLHKYTGIFESYTWQEMAVLGDKDLEDRGVSALGARRKLLKVFETVRAKTGLSAPGGGGSSGTASSPAEARSPVSPTGTHSHSGSGHSPTTPNMGSSPADNAADEEHA